MTGCHDWGTGETGQNSCEDSCSEVGGQEGGDHQAVRGREEGPDGRYPEDRMMLGRLQNEAS